ncbi:hypothetical protein [Levilactobacillus cerevisiae]|uniref:hypothetical protein n=1 Tax=Levilactobacillus cerevisiae TaxID=1704076 RepID=UPI000F788095|nr:hypothetical protein [Levilactobacillus cerevisiae]
MRREMWAYGQEHYRRLVILVVALIVILIAAGFQITYHLAVLGDLNLLALMLPGLILSTTICDWEVKRSAWSQLGLVFAVSTGYLIILGGGLFVLLQVLWSGSLFSGSAIVMALAYGGSAAFKGLGLFWLLLVSLGTLQLIVGLYYRRLPAIVSCIVPFVGLAYHGITSLTAVPWSYAGILAAEFLVAAPILTVMGTAGIVVTYLYLAAHKNRRIPKDSTVHLNE